MMKKLLSCLMAGVLAVQGAGIRSAAAAAGTIRVDSVCVPAGARFSLPVTLESNPGIAALSLDLTYDADKLELVGVKDGEILGTSVFMSGKDLTMIPYTMNWDDLSQNNNTGTGTVAVLSFRAMDNVTGSSRVSVSVNQKSTHNVNMEEIPFSVTDGTVTFTETETEQPQTEPPDIPADSSAVIQADTVSAKHGDRISVPIRMYGNPGITALSLNISYDNTKLKLLGAENGNILGTSVFAAGNDLSLIPYTLNWDDLSTENNTANGIVAALKFEVLGNAGDTAAVRVAVNQKSTYNVDMEEIAFEASDGAVLIRETSPASTTTAPITTSASAAITETTTSRITSVQNPGTVTTAAVSATAASAVTTSAIPADVPAIAADCVTARSGATVSVPVRIRNNPGITALSLNISYDNTKLKLLGTEDGRLLGESVFTPGKNLNLIPYKLNWDDLSSQDNTGNGIVAALQFEVLGSDGETAEVRVTVNQDSTFNIAMEEVAFKTANGAVIISNSASVTQMTTTGATKTETQTTTAEKTTASQPIITMVNPVTTTAMTSAETAKTTTVSSSRPVTTTAKTTSVIPVTTTAKTASVVPVTTTGKTASTPSPGTSGTTKSQGSAATTASAETAKTTMVSSSRPVTTTAKTTSVIPVTTTAKTASVVPVTTTGKTASTPSPGTSGTTKSQGSAATTASAETAKTTSADSETTSSKSTTAGTVTTSPANQKNGSIYLDHVTAKAGGTAAIRIRMRNNPGITALSLNISYDKTKLKLLGTSDGKILGTSSFLSGKDLTAIPYTLNWDDLAAENNTGNGVLATLTFEVLPDASGSAEVSVMLNQRSTFNVDLNEIPFTTANGSVKIAADESSDTTVIPPSTGQTGTETNPITTETEPVIPDSAVIRVATVSAHKGDTVRVPLRLYNNPGISALSLNISYDSAKLKLLGAADGKIFGTSSFLSGKDLTAIPYTLNWDDLAVQNNTGNGVVAVLTFEVLADSGDADISLAVNQRSTFNVNLKEVPFEAINGKVRIREAQSGETDFLLGDVNLDGVISIEDAQLTLKAYTNRIAGNDPGLSEKQIKAADVNQDGEISVDDAQNILIYYVNNTVAGKATTWEALLEKQP